MPSYTPSHSVMLSYTPSTSVMPSYTQAHSVMPSYTPSHCDALIHPIKLCDSLIYPQFILMSSYTPFHCDALIHPDSLCDALIHPPLNSNLSVMPLSSLHSLCSYTQRAFAGHASQVYHRICKGFVFSKKTKITVCVISQASNDHRG